MINVSARAIQLIQRALAIQDFDVVRADLYTAKRDIIRKRKSIKIQAGGAAAQQVTEHVFATNKNGVARQCIRQSPLATAPTRSELSVGILKSMLNKDM